MGSQGVARPLPLLVFLALLRPSGLKVRSAPHGQPRTHPGAPRPRRLVRRVFITRLSSPHPAEGPALPEPRSGDRHGFPSALQRRVSSRPPERTVSHSFPAPRPTRAQRRTPARPGLRTRGCRGLRPPSAVNTWLSCCEHRPLQVFTTDFQQRHQRSALTVKPAAGREAVWKRNIGEKIKS